MFNWSTDEASFKKNAFQQFKQWRLVQLINYGLDGEKLDGQTVKKLWPKIETKIISQDIKDYLEFILWPKNQS